MNPIEELNKEVAENSRKLGEDQELKSFTWDWVKKFHYIDIPISLAG